jgi:hypothetical protein
MGERGLALKQGLKVFLKSIDPQSTNPDTFLFTGQRGKFIDFHNFANRVWNPTLKKLAVLIQPWGHFRQAFKSGHIIKTAPTSEGGGCFYRRTVISSAIETQR